MGLVVPRQRIAVFGGEIVLPEIVRGVAGDAGPPQVAGVAVEGTGITAGGGGSVEHSSGRTLAVLLIDCQDEPWKTVVALDCRIAT